MKRILALLLTLVLIVSLIPVTAFSEEYSDNAETVSTVGDTFDVEKAYSEYILLSNEEKLEYLLQLSEQNREMFLAYLALVDMTLDENKEYADTDETDVEDNETVNNNGEIEIEYVARIGDMLFDSMASAVEIAEDGDIIELLKDIGDYISVAGECFTVRKNGFELNVIADKGGQVIETLNLDGTYTYRIGVCTVDGVIYGSVSEAVNSAKSGKTIVLISNCDEANTISVAKNITIDINGFEIQSTIGNTIEVTAGMLTVTDDAYNFSSGKICEDINVSGSGKLRILNGKIDGSVSSVSSTAVSIEGGLFKTEPLENYLAKCHVSEENDDEVTYIEGYFFKVVERHEYVTTYTWSADYSGCTAVAKCKVSSSHQSISEDGIVTEEQIPASCTENGYTKYTAVFETLGTSEKTVEDTRATGHRFEMHKCVTCKEMEEGFIDSGSCGENLNWVLDNKGVLVISGEGTVLGLDSFEYSSEIKSIILLDGISAIGYGAFEDFTAITDITIPVSVTEISEDAFDGCSSLKEIHYSGTESEWNEIQIAEHTIPDAVVIKVNEMSASKLIMKIDLPADGLVAGDAAEVHVYDISGKEYIIGEEVLVSPDSNKVVTIKENIITGESAGQATITAKMVDDEYSRSVSEVVNVISRDSKVMGFYLTDQTTGLKTTDSPATVFNFKAEDYAAVQKAYVIGTKKNINSGKLISDGLTYVSSDSKVAKIAKISKGDYSGCYGLTIPKGASGSCTVTASFTNKSNPSQNYTVTAIINVCDFTPRIESSKITFNSYLENGVSVPFVASYGNEIKTIGIYEEIKSGKTTVLDENESEKLKVVYNNNQLTIKTADPSATIKNQTINAVLKVEGLITDCEVPITVTVKNSVPAVTVKQSSKLNMFYSDSTSDISMYAKDADIEDVEYIGLSSFNGVYKNGTFTVSLNNYRDAKGKIVQGTVRVTFKGYKAYITDTGYPASLQPVKEQKLSVSTATTAPSLKLQNTSGTVYDAEKVPREFKVVILNKDGTVPQLEDGAVRVTSGNAEFVKQNNNEITLRLTAESKTNIVLSVQNENWSKSVSLKYTANINSSMPTVKPAQTTLTLNLMYPALSVDTDITTSHVNAEIDDVLSNETFEQTGNVMTDAVECKIMDGKIVASITNPSEVKTGTYGYRFTPYIKINSTKSQAVNAVEFKVSVVSKKAEAVLKGSGSMDLISRKNSAMVYKVTLKNAVADITDVRLDAASNSMFSAEVNPNNRSEIIITFNDEYTGKYNIGTYTVTPTLTVNAGGIESKIVCGQQKIKVTQSTLKVSSSASQIVYQSQNRNKEIVFTVSLTSPAEAKIERAQIGNIDKTFIKNLADAASNIYFAISKDRKTLYVHVLVNDTSKLVAGKTYTLPITVIPEGFATSKAYASVKLSVKVMK